MSRLLYSFIMFFVCVYAYAGLLQNEDFKTESELISAGGTKSQLLNDTKVYVTGNGINKTLDDAIVDGDIGGGVELTTKGNLLGFGTATEECVLDKTNGNVLTVDSTATCGFDFKTPTASPSFTTVNKASSTTLATSGEDNVVCDTTSGSVTLTLPAAGTNNGLTYKISNAKTVNSCIIDPNGAELIGGYSTFNLESAGDSIIITSNGINWVFLSKDVKVYVLVESNNGQSIANNGEFVEYEDEINDSHNAYNTGTGVFVCPTSETLTVSFNYLIGFMTKRTVGVIRHYQSDGTTIIKQYSHFGAYNATESGGSHTASIDCAKDEQIKFFLFQDEGASKNLSNNANFNWITISSAGK